MNEQTRPPLGIMPEHIWDSRRFDDLQSAIRHDFAKIKEFLFTRDGETILTYDQVIEELNNEH